MRWRCNWQVVCAGPAVWPGPDDDAAAAAPDAVETGLRRQISSLIGPFRHDLAGRKGGELRGIADVQHSCAFLGAQLVAWLGARREGALIGVGLTVFHPAP